MQILLLSIMARCGVYTHVRDLAISLQKLGISPILGLINSAKARKTFRISNADFVEMAKLLQGIPYFCYENDSELLREIKSKQIKLVHAHSPLVMSTAHNLSALLNIPYVITLHGVLNWSRLYPQSMKEATKIIAIGPEVAKSAGEENMRKTTIIFNGVDLDRFCPAANFQCKEGPLRILWVGRTNGSASHGAECLTGAIRLLQNRGLQLETKALGFATGANIKGLESCGWVYDPVGHLQWGHLVFGRGRALREAMSCGNAGFLLAQGYGGRIKEDWFKQGRMPQLSGSYKHGAKELDSFQLAEDILYFHLHRQKLAEARSEARKIAEKYFDGKIMSKQTYDVYREALALY